MNNFARALILAASALSPAAIANQAPPPEGQSIVVTGTQDRQSQVRAFVNGVTVETADQVAQFHAPVCPAGYGLPNAYNAVVAERVRAVARAAGIAVADDEDCEPNILILVAEDGEAVVNLLRRARPQLFMTLELADIRRAVAGDGPVHAWHITELRGAHGDPVEHISYLSLGLSGPPIYLGKNAHLVRGISPTLTRRTTRQDLAISVVVFDLAALNGLSLAQIGDYAAMRTLARTHPAGVAEGHSILALFDDVDAGRVPPSAATRWDEAYLRSLYRTSSATAGGSQRANIANAIGRRLAEEEAETE